MNEEFVTSEMVDIVYRAIEKHGLIGFLDGVFDGRVHLRLYVPNSIAAEPVENLLLGKRSSNAMKRQRCDKIGDVVELISSGELAKIRNVGRKSVSEIQTEILCKVWENMNKNSRLRFCRDLIALNFNYSR